MGNKRILCLLLCLVLMLCIVPVASAQEDYAASVNGVGYTTVAEATSKANGGVVKLLKDSQEQVTAAGDLYLDLNGHTLAGLTMASGMLYGMDTTTDDYDCEGGYGKVLSLTGSYAPNYKTDITGTWRRYLAVNENGAISFHRLYLGLVYASMRPASRGVGYKAIFAGDSKVVEQLDTAEAFGYILRLEGGEPLNVWKPVSAFKSLKTVTLLLQNFDAATHGQTNVHASVQLKLKDGTVISSASYSTTLKTVMETVNDTYTTYTQEQISLLADWIKEVPVMMDWRTENIVPREITATTLIVEKVNVTAGQTSVKVPVSVINNPGITGMTISVHFDDSVMTLKKVSNGDALSGLTFQKPKNYKDGCNLLWYGTEPDEVMDGEAFTMTFDIAATAQPGEYTVTLAYQVGYDMDRNSVDVTVQNGSITVA